MNSAEHEPGRVPAVRITVVTYRRAHLLERALKSIQAQSYADWTADVVNDDPSDPVPREMVERLRDRRFRMFAPEERRGGAANFNLAFRPGPEPYATMLEDDNWWEPEFLAAMVSALDARPAASLITGNERIWQEDESGRWRDTGRTLRPDRQTVREHPLDPAEKCGSAILCNGAMVLRLSAVSDWRIPAAVPIDVGEHYRERLAPHPILVHDRALANLGTTRATFRSSNPFDWDKHQVLLIGSVFDALPESDRPPLAETLWRRARAEQPLHRTALMLTGLFVPRARALWTQATAVEKCRLAAHLVRRRGYRSRYRRLLQAEKPLWSFLQQGWVADAIRGRNDDRGIESAERQAWAAQA